MKLSFFIMLLLIVRLEEIKNESSGIKAGRENYVETQAPRSLRKTNSEDDKRKLSLIVQSMKKTLNLSSKSPYSISRPKNKKQLKNNGLGDLQQLNQELNNQQPQGEMIPNQSNIIRFSNNEFIILPTTAFATIRK